ncbi:GAF domain-containing protein [Microcoleus sp. FACHB-1515]|uniref:ATP-binding protein n=1 Tax=Cyanophyceae TaxID=3028117 RepID=UPI0016889301|nr:ATP-binding protein [Microcoleus sp. FACHB-1515]MBD2090137.1 GAF domain-containing protein [Microcoleus sp. FACHB-1515]
MTSPSDFSPSLSNGFTANASAAEQPFDRSEASGSNTDLVLTQDATGRYLSFFWPAAAQYGLEPARLIGRSIDPQFGPVAPQFYLERVQRALDLLLPEQFQCPFCFAGQYFLFNLVVSPILLPQGQAHQVVVVGQLHDRLTESQAQTLAQVAACPAVFASFDRYHKLLTQITWDIRRTLDLETIWQRAVNGLGEALAVSRCVLCTHTPGEPLRVVAEYLQAGLPSLLGQEITPGTYLSRALTTTRPITVPSEEINPDDLPHPVLAIATCYQDQPNSLILLHQLDRGSGVQGDRQWHEAELELLRELADQVGTGIAHATLFAESNSLAAELQKANDSLMQQHQELEDARAFAEEASRLKSEFLANTSHELRTPLNGMIGFLKLIMDGMADDPEEQNEFLQEAYRSAVHLHDILNDILDIAKIEAGKMQLDLNPVRLDDLLSDVEDFTRPLAHQKHLSFEIRLPATRDEVVLLGNYQRLLQVMLNLVGNAIKFTHEGGITITAEVIEKKILGHNQDQPSAVKISVADTGIGVSLEKQDKLFQSFSQVDGSRTRQYGGTGLGLAISQKLVEAMNGVVNFYSMGEGLGSTVTFTVPLYQDPLMITAQAPDTMNLLTQ